MRPAARGLAGFCAAALFAGALLAAAGKDKLAELQARFDRESNSVHKAKVLEKLGGAQFEETRLLEKAANFSAAGLLWEKFRDNARLTLDALKKQHPDAERHSNGYRELEICLREGIRELSQSQIVAPPEFRPPLQIVRRDLSAMDDEVLRMLFPRRTVNVPPAPPSGEERQE